MTQKDPKSIADIELIETHITPSMRRYLAIWADPTCDGVTEACRRAKVSPNTIATYRGQNPTFAQLVRQLRAGKPGQVHAELSRSIALQAAPNAILGIVDDSQNALHPRDRLQNRQTVLKVAGILQEKADSPSVNYERAVVNMYGGGLPEPKSELPSGHKKDEEGDA